MRAARFPSCKRRAESPPVGLCREAEICARFDAVGFWKKPENADKEANRSPLASGGRGPRLGISEKTDGPQKLSAKPSSGEEPLNLRRRFVQPGNADNVK